MGEQLVQLNNIGVRMRDLSWFLTRCREKLNLDVQDAAEMIGLPAWELRELELGYQIEISDSVAGRIVRHYRVSAEELQQRGATITRSHSNQLDQKTKQR